MKRHSFFEGWYLKHQSHDKVLALIPARHIDRKGRAFATLQVITNSQSHLIKFPAGRLLSDHRHFQVTLDRCVFSERGVHLNIKSASLTLTGDIAYGPWTPLSSDIMGPYRFLPFMQCKHGVLSLFHRVSGTVLVNGTPLNLSHGIGYIEKDWGRSFPSEYLWTCCNWIDKKSRTPACVMLSIADIPYAGIRFTGCICAILYEERQYRLATYHGVKILERTDREVLICQGDYTLHVTLLADNPVALAAPSLGSMTRTIHESPSCQVRYQFFEKQQKVFDIVSSHAGFETGSSD